MSLSLSIYIYICMYVYISLSIYIYIYIYIHTYIHTYTWPRHPRPPRTFDCAGACRCRRVETGRDGKPAPGGYWTVPVSVIWLWTRVACFVFPRQKQNKRNINIAPGAGMIDVCVMPALQCRSDATHSNTRCSLLLSGFKWLSLAHLKTMQCAWCCHCRKVKRSISFSQAVVMVIPLANAAMNIIHQSMAWELAWMRWYYQVWVVIRLRRMLVGTSVVRNSRGSSKTIFKSLGNRRRKSYNIGPQTSYFGKAATTVTASFASMLMSNPDFAIDYWWWNVVIRVDVLMLILRYWLFFTHGRNN